ncbi:MAG TPA: hypothetical protein VMF55_16390, partial [Solirubrobacterales bacterium]|nr:hypothetical protein [Solirubrobacterales bacterium]
MSVIQKIGRATFAFVVCLVIFSAAAVSTASAQLHFSEVGVMFRQGGEAISRQAGGHPDFSFNFLLDKAETAEVPVESVRNLDLELPPGIVANAAALPTCTMDQLIGASNFYNAVCPTDSQVGLVDLSISFGTFAGRNIVGLFNIKHGPEVPALFGFDYLGYVATIVPEVRPSDHGVTAGSSHISQAVASLGAKVTLWGYPASPVHDRERAVPGGVFVFPGLQEPLASTAPKVPFFRNPTSCPPEASSFTAKGDSWVAPEMFDTRTFDADEEGNPIRWGGCELLPFAPHAKLSASNRAAHSPAGLDVQLEVPQSEGPEGLSTSDVKQVSVTLPEGMAISPSVAAGQSGCTLAQVGLADNDAPSCPVSSKIGTVEVVTPLLNETLQGEFVLAAQNDNPFHSTYATYMLIKGPGFWLKLPGELNVDRRTGQIQTVFSELPQLPFESVDVQLESGPGAPLASPDTCGTYSAKAEYTPWARPTEPVVQTIPMTFDQSCSGGGFAPGLKGGTVNPSAGRRSPFVLTVSRQDGEQNLSRIDVTLPKGQLASLKGVAECPEAQAGSGQCPASSQIGVAKAAVGVGTEPLQVPQPGKAPTALFLGGPYKGAPLSLIALVPAQAGPFDLGDVVVRTALEVDPTTAQVTAKSDPLPQIIEGVPLSYREIRIELTRPEFAVNPTSCEPTQITSTLTSVAGAQAHPSVPYQVGSCASLGFSPKLQLAMSGSTKRAGNPALSATLKAPAGQANIASTTVILPKTVFIDQRHVDNPCTRVQFAA